MAQSEKTFRELLCEGRAQPVETTDPSAARLIGELKRQVGELRSELEVERLKCRQQAREQEHEIRRLKEESERKLEASVAAAVARIDHGRAEEVRRLEERLFKEHENELRALIRDKNEELRSLHQRMERERERSVSMAVQQEHQQAVEEMQQMVPEGECRRREHRITSEMFRLNDLNQQLEEQVRNLTRENRTQIDQIRRMRHEHAMELQGIVHQHQAEASRETAQLKLAERIIAEKDHDLQQVERRVDTVLAEKDAMAEELAHARSLRALTPDLTSSGEHPRPLTPSGKVGCVGMAMDSESGSCMCACVGVCCGWLPWLQGCRLLVTRRLEMQNRFQSI